MTAPDSPADGRPDGEPDGERTGEQTVETGLETGDQTVSLAAETAATGPTVAGWRLDDMLQAPPPAMPVPPAPPPQPRRPAYYVWVTVAVMLTVGLIAGLAVRAVNPPLTRVSGTPAAPNIPRLPPPTDSTPPGAPTTTTAAPPAGPYAELAAHPLSSSAATMPDQTCALPTFDRADTEQVGFYQAAKVCADAAFGALLTAAELPAPTVEVQTVHSGPTETPCGAVEPAAPATQCAGTVYMTPAYLRDVEGNDRYPGRYFGVFLREYARAVLETGGLGPLYAEITDVADRDLRIARQATCLAGIAAGAMTGRGAVDANITDEIRARLSELDAPPDAAAWLDKGFNSRQLSACDSWS
ncbi:hypothetical protein [Actinophytocola sediminis]